MPFLLASGAALKLGLLAWKSSERLLLFSFSFAARLITATNLPSDHTSDYTKLGRHNLPTRKLAKRNTMGSNKFLRSRLHASPGACPCQIILFWKITQDLTREASNSYLNRAS